MSTDRYFSRDGTRISLAVWKKYQADDAYRTIKQYDNGVVQVTLLWSGRVDAATHASYSEYWPMFILLVKNYKPDGTLAVDPADSDKTFPTKEAGLAAYEAFLVKWTECEVSAHTGVFEEVGNEMEQFVEPTPEVPVAPPPPPDPNKPQTESDALGDTGAW
jgi:hypothetical protein